jgi:polar amino acid transport system substrate-binding protein
VRNVLVSGLFWLLLGIYFCGNTLAQDNEIILATGEWEPYTSETLDQYGFFTEIVTAIITEMGYRPKYIFVPWKRAELMVKYGQAFATFPFIITDERKKDFDFSERIFRSRGLFFYTTKRFDNEVDFEELRDLKPYVIGGVLGYWYDSLFEKAHIEPHYVASEQQLIKMLYTKRVDLVPTDELVGWSIIRQLYPDDMDVFRTVDTPLNESSFHVMISKKYPHAKDLTEQFNLSLERIRLKKIYSKILEKYGVSE